MAEKILEMRKINKIFPGVHAVKDVDFSVEKGEVRALIGKNGAGKSTLIKVVTGINVPDSGEFWFDSAEIKHFSPSDMNKFGIEAIYQENDLVGHFNVAQSILLNNEITRMKGLTIDKRKMHEQAAEILSKHLMISLDTRRLVRDLSVGERQLVQIAHCLVKKPKLIIFDEPTAPLNASEIERLFAIIRSLKKQGSTIVYISHRLEEIFEIADTVTIMRDGEKVADLELAKSNENELIKHMTGGSFELVAQDIHHKPSEEEMLSVSDMNTEYLKEVAFSLKKGEVLGVFGAEGAGQEDLARAVFGLKKATSGRLELEGRTVKLGKPDRAIKMGIGYVSRDRKEEGLVQDFNILENVTLANIDKYSRFGFLKTKEEQSTTKKLIKKLSIMCRNFRNVVRYLSGGNQQKVAISRYFTLKLKVLILDYPTSGIDVEAKSEVYDILKELSKEGTSIILITPEYEEIEALCHRSLVMRDGKIVADIDGSKFSEDLLLSWAIGTGNSREGG